jgi:hypothetical protein
VAADGYLVAFSRTDNLSDLHTYFGESDVYLVDRKVAPRSAQARNKGPQEDDEVRERVRKFLTKEPLNVAREAGPYHVVHFLVSPRMVALAELDALDTGQIETLRRMVGYVRRKWSSYVSEHRREHTQNAAETDIASKLSDKFYVAANVAEEGGTVKRAALISDLRKRTPLWWPERATNCSGAARESPGRRMRAG